MQQAEWEVVMLRKAFHSACCLTYGFAVSESNYRAGLMALSVGRFAGSGMGHVPKLPTVGRVAASRNASQPPRKSLSLARAGSIFRALLPENSKPQMLSNSIFRALFPINGGSMDEYGGSMRGYGGSMGGFAKFLIFCALIVAIDALFAFWPGEYQYYNAQGGILVRVNR
jgi:hypothetical protein